MNWYRILLGVGITFSITASVYVMRYPCPGMLFAILTFFSASMPTVSGSRTGALLGSYGGAMSSLGVYIFITSILFGPGMFPPDLFYHGGPRPSFFWFFLSVWLFWLGTAMALRGILLSVAGEQSSRDSSENGRSA